jgi:hypothetical protein
MLVRQVTLELAVLAAVAGLPLGLVPQPVEVEVVCLLAAVVLLTPLAQVVLLLRDLAVHTAEAVGV